MGVNPLDAILGIADNVIDKIIPDKEKAMEYKLETRRLQQAGEFRELDHAFNLMLAEAKSNDKWTSRARPSFLYVMYTYVLAAIPMGVLFAFKPEIAEDVVNGVKLWLESIPPYMWATFTAGYLGYVKKRSDDKKVLVEAKEKTGLLSMFGF